MAAPGAAGGDQAELGVLAERGTQPDSWGGHVLYGSIGSPYSMKMRALLRYRRVPHVFKELGPGPMNPAEWEKLGLRHLRPQTIPVLRWPGGAVANESTALVQRLEAEHGGRSVTPPDPCWRFLAALLEDWGDEWLTKAMFGYRWNRPRDQRWSASALAGHSAVHNGGAALARIRGLMGTTFGKRQAERTALVGCQDNDELDRIMDDVLGPLEAHLDGGGVFLFGRRPSNAEFGMFGQIYQWAIDSTPQERMRERYPSCYSWLAAFDDLSGHDIGAWLRPSDPLPEVTAALLRACAAAYLPFLAANAAAFRAGQATVEVPLWGGALTHRQKPFKYQVQCYDRLRADLAALRGEPGERCRRILRDAGALRLLASDDARL